MPLAPFPSQGLRFGFRLAASPPSVGGLAQSVAQQLSGRCGFQFLAGVITTLAKQTTGGGDFSFIRGLHPYGVVAHMSQNNWGKMSHFESGSGLIPFGPSRPRPAVQIAEVFFHVPKGPIKRH